VSYRAGNGSPSVSNATTVRYKGLPGKMGRNWTKEEIQAAVERGNHESAKLPGAIDSYQDEIEEKVRIVPGIPAKK